MQLISQIANLASLNGLDLAWQRALESSIIISIGSAFKSAMSKIDGEKVRKVGSFCQSLSFAVGVVLFAVLALPMFKDDKDTLAYISLSGFALWILGYLLGGKEVRKATATDMLVLVFLAINVVAACASHYFIPAILGLRKIIVYICSYFYLTAILQNSPKRKLVLVSILVMAAVVESLVGFDQFRNHVQPLATWEDPTVETQGTRIFSWLGNPNLLAGYLIPIGPLAFALGFSALTSKRWLLAIPPLIAGAMISVAIVLTGSRGGYLAIGAAGATISLMAVARFWIAKPKARIFIVVLCIVLPILLLLGLHFVPSFEQSVTSIFAGREHSSNSYRINVWNASWRMFLDNWWIGIGPGNVVFRLAYGLYMVSGYDALGTYCVPLEVAVECGVVGLITFALLIISLFARAHISFWSANPDKSTGLSLEHWLTAGAVAALVGLLAQGMVDTVFYRPQVQFIFWLAVALIVTDSRGSNSLSRTHN
ncbi:MAG: O-antigen ligase family protein [Candidatus Melainabacteria bacterium]|nr:O-antigen ligase family protein [Candidatus Melainabacteria bacterium]